MLKPNLTPRLKTISELINHSDKMADIGTDHAYLPVCLIDSGKCKTAIASDIRSGPLKRAETTVQKYNMGGLIELRLGAGLETVTLSDKVDTIVIAGMGGLVITEIIRSSIEIVKAAKHIILQPMTMAPELRTYLYSSALGRIDEYFAFEGEKIYNIISVDITQDSKPIKLTSAEAFIGKSLIESKPDGFDTYIRHLKHKLENQITGLKNGTTAEAGEKLKNAEIMLSEIKNIK